MNLEVEIRAKVDDFAEIKKALEKIRADFIKSEAQTDRVFGASKFLDSDNMIIEGGLSARIREVDSKRTLEFKEILREKGGMELSCEVSSIELAEKLLKKLDFEEAFTIKKLRESYSYKDFTICLDKVEQLGNFIEIEKITSEDETDRVKKECNELLNTIAPNSEIELRKYGDLMQELINRKRKAS